jgi:endonuclease/exonuclease/phosphatase (EEP) superfamily protein YafD
VASRLRDVFAHVGEGHGGTFSLLRPFGKPVRIDYIFASSEVTPLSARVVPTKASDHHALVARVGLPVRAAFRRAVGAA